MPEIKWPRLYEVLQMIAQTESIDEIGPTILESLSLLIPYEQAHILTYDHESDAFTHPVLLDISTQSYVEYEEHYQFCDPIKADYFDQPGALRSSDALDYNHLCRSEYYCDFMRPNHFHYMLGTDLHCGERLLGTLTLIRPKGTADFKESELQSLHLLAPQMASHLFRVMLLKQQREHTVLGEISRRVGYLGLTTREEEIAMLLVQGYSNTQIADTLFISSETVKRHLSTMYRKGRVNSRAGFIARMLGL